MKYLSTVIFAFLVLLSISNCTVAQSQYAVVVYLTDKGNTPYQLTQPQDFLTSEAIIRKQKFNIPIDSLDLPVNELYVQQLLTTSNGVLHASTKWFNAVVLLVNDTQVLSAIRSFNFVSKAEVIAFYPGGLHLRGIGKFEGLSGLLQAENFDANYYGQAWQQIHLAEGEALHERGFDGRGMRIAVIDAGFSGVENNRAFRHLYDSSRLIETYSFLDRSVDVNTNGHHGTFVLSTMAANIPNEMVGTAPNAQYALYSVDDEATEHFTETFNWVAAIERADSMGMDVVNSSLGYNRFDNPNFDFTYADLNGSTTLITQAANLGVAKGMLVVNSAGNEGATTWKYLLAPADADAIMTVANVNDIKIINPTSSWGFPNTLKPDVSGMGTYVAVITPQGNVSRSTGTSFAAPIITGLAACYWSLDSTLSPQELIVKIKSVGHLGSNAEEDRYGYGVPNFRLLVEQKLSIAPSHAQMKFVVFPNPTNKKITVKLPKKMSGKITVIDVLGQIVLQQTLDQRTELTLDVTPFANGNYIIRFQNETDYGTEVFTKF